ncbi:MAG: S1 family peptidase [Sphingomonas bacterium]|nr:S1 family peptidase [Sphingomonas bacterium]
MAMIAALMAGFATAASAQAPLARATPPAVVAVRIQTSAEALAQDAAAYARRYGVTIEQAVVRLRALQASAAVTDRIRETYRARLVGVAIDHAPALRISVLLTGTVAVTDTSMKVDGLVVPIVFRTGGAATGDEVIRAMLQRAPELNALLPLNRGMGLDARTGELVMLVRATDAARADLAALRARAEALTGVKVRFDLADRAMENLALAGGARIEGVHPDGKRYACTTGFAVTDGTRSGIATAAHCPDEVVYQDPDGGTVPLAFAGQWGARTQDVQVNVSTVAQQPLFYADRRAGSLRTLAGSRSRLSTRAGEWLCHYGESSGYSCAEVELTQFAPPGLLCGGACAPTWVSVRTSDCRSGDSGGPVFSGDIAFGITKGGSGGRNTRCNFYFYMSTDFLPAGWRLLR